jgi:hypothetical protein
VTERWSEDEAGTEGRYGCAVRRDWDAPGVSCDGAHATGEKVSGWSCFERRGSMLTGRRRRFWTAGSSAMR